MATKRSVAILFGGQSAEHNVSLVSAKCILEAINRELFVPVLIGISKTGEWYPVSEEQLLQTSFENPIDFVRPGEEIFLNPGNKGARVMEVYGQKNPVKVDFAFPIVHGPLGEDGTLQALFRLLKIPFAGCDVTSSALCMDKDSAKRVLMSHNIPVSNFITVRRQQKLQYEIVTKKLGKTLYIKPCNMGSSVGVSKATNEEDFSKAVEKAFRFDNKILIESMVDGIEVEVSVLGNEYPKASVPGSFVVDNQFYSYDAKYISDSATKFQIPASNDERVIKDIQERAISTYKALGCEGFARVDLFVTKSNEILVNEVNTLPGFTPISMYPRLWQENGVSFKDLITDIINLGEERYRKFTDRSTEIE